MIFEPRLRGIEVLGVEFVAGKIKAHIVGGYPGGAAAQVCIEYGIPRLRVILQEPLLQCDWFLGGVNAFKLIR